MTDLLIKICREEEKETESKRQKEVEAKVQEAIKRVANDLNAFSKSKKQEQETNRTDSPPALPSDGGAKKISIKTEQEFHEPRHPNETHRTNPVGIADKRLRQELAALPGIGHIHLRPKRYKITMKPLGIDDFEYRIDGEKLIINVNVSHPAYEQAVEEKCVEINVFRAIGSAFAWKESKTSGEMHQTLDELIRFQAFRLATRRLRKRSTRNWTDRLSRGLSALDGVSASDCRCSRHNLQRNIFTSGAPASRLQSNSPSKMLYISAVFAFPSHRTSLLRLVDLGQCIRRHISNCL